MLQDRAEAAEVVPRGRGRRRRVGVALVVAALLILVLWSGARRTATPVATGTSLDGTAPPSAVATAPATRDARPLRFAIFNIRGGRATDERVDLGRTAAAVRAAGAIDLLGLNEVHGGGIFGAGASGGLADQAAVLGRALNVPYLFAPTERRWWHDDFGNGVLCRLPVTSWARLPISTPAAQGFRNVLLLRAAVAGRTINVLITHLERRGEREPEMRIVGGMFQSLEPPAVLLGDLNAMPGESPELESLRKAAGVADVLTRPGLKHQDTCWILARGMTAGDAGAVDEGASDHPLFWADLTVTDSH